MPVHRRHEGRVARRLAGYCLAIFVTLLCGPAAAQQTLTIENGKSITLPQGSDVETVFISDTSVADARVSPGDRVFVFGKSVGETTLIATHLDSGAETAYTIVVTHRLSEIRSVLNSRFPGEQIAVKSSRGSLMVTGLVSDERTRATVIKTLRSATPDTSIIDRLTVGGSNVICLRVVLLEVSRNEAENFGIDWSATVADNGFFIGADTSNFAPFYSGAQSGQVGLHRGFINEDSTIRKCSNGRKRMFEPVRALLPYLGATAFVGNKRFFFVREPKPGQKVGDGRVVRPQALCVGSKRWGERPPTASICQGRSAMIYKGGRSCLRLPRSGST